MKNNILHFIYGESLLIPKNKTSYASVFMYFSNNNFCGFLLDTIYKFFTSLRLRLTTHFSHTYILRQENVYTIYINKLKLFT